MIRVARLIELLQQLPPDAEVSAYEGEDTGLSITKGDDTWWIRAYGDDEEDTHTEGFDT